MIALFEGIRVLELATWQMVPAAGALLAEFGADVIKVERPPAGDPQRALVGVPSAPGGSNLSMEQVNRGKRSIGLDISNPAAAQVLGRLLEGSDVLLTNFLPPVRRKLGIDLESVRAWNPAIIYASANSLGGAGPEGGRPGFDSTAYSARGGVGHALRSPEADRPAPSRPGFGDKQGAMNLAFGVTAALLRRARTGVAGEVETSLLASAIWVTSSDLVASKATGTDRTGLRLTGGNPATGQYRTSDGRWLSIQADGMSGWWPAICRSASRPELADDPRFLDPVKRRENADFCLDTVTSVFASLTLDEVRECFREIPVAWEPYQTPIEVLADPQVAANDYVTEVEYPDGSAVLIRAPVRFDGEVHGLRPAPRFAEHTFAVLREAGFAEAELDELVTSGVIM